MITEHLLDDSKKDCGRSERQRGRIQSFGKGYAAKLLQWLLICARIPLVAALEVGEDFTSNIFSDLAPLLTLFGEQVAKQFMAGSTTWEDHILFAMGPLGIITAIVGAIRIGGPLWLRAIIGRARESQASAEEELTTSTSQDVCEIWNGRSIIRLVGSPRILQLVYLDLDESKANSKLGPHDRLLTLEAGTRSGLKFEKAQDIGTDGIASPRLCAPNLFLNLRPQISAKDKWELRGFALVGVILQAGGLAFSGTMAYHPDMRIKLQKEGHPVDSYAYPLATAGTLVLILGMWICSFVIERSTEEESWIVKNPNRKNRHSRIPFRVAWIQQGGAVTDQQFGSYAIFGKDKRESILTSRLSADLGISGHSWLPRIYAKPDDIHHYSTCKSAKSSRLDPSKLSQVIVTFGTFISVVGFIIQFTGLRSLHFSASVAQLIVTLVMVAIRAWVRRGLAFTPSAFRIPQGYELEWLSTRLLEPDQLWPT
ncbi:hypothetical protein BJ508DRAFT_208215, partial [Ascobolus immersus RN42]